MYKALIIVLIAVIGIACGSDALGAESYNIKLAKPAFTKPTVRVDLCPTCINVAEQSINILLNLILDTGIIGSCQTLCTALEQKTGKEIIGVICEIACDGVGIAEFIKLLENSDLDPIYYCEIARFCPVKDDGDCNITRFSILPATGVKGQTFTIGITYVTINGTGTGELDIDIHTPDRIPLGAGFLIEAKKPGTYSETITIKAAPDPDCDPTQEPCEEWLPGTYNVTVQICNGECGSKHPHSAIYDTKKGSFQLTA